MLHIRRVLSCIWDDDGQDLVEYGLLVSFLAIAGYATFSSLGQDICSLWSSIATKLASTN